MKYKFSCTILLFFLLLGSIACNTEPSPEGFEPPSPTSTIAPLGDAPTDTITASAEPTSTVITDTEALEGGGANPRPSPPSPEVKAQALTNLNLRAGPGANYAVVGSLPAESEITLVGRNEDNSWLVAADTNGDHVWLTGDLDLVQIDSQLVEGLPIVEMPPLAYNVNNVDVGNVLNLIPLVLHNPSSFTCASHAGLNNLLPLAEGNVIGPHSGDFVHVKMGNVLFKYSNGSLRLIRENPMERFEGGVESLPLDTALQMFENREVVWNGEFGDWPARGVTGCDESAQP